MQQRLRFDNLFGASDMSMKCELRSSSSLLTPSWSVLLQEKTKSPLDLDKIICSRECSAIGPCQWVVELDDMIIMIMLRDNVTRIMRNNQLYFRAHSTPPAAFFCVAQSHFDSQQILLQYIYSAAPSHREYGIKGEE